MLPTKKYEQTKKILIIRIDHIGDVILSTSVIEPLRKKYPSAVLDFMVPSWAFDIVKDDPYISNVIKFDPPWFSSGKKNVFDAIVAFMRMTSLIRAGRYDAVIDLRGDSRHIAAMFFAGVKKRISYGITGLGFLLTDLVEYDEKAHETKRDHDLLKAIGVVAEEPQVRLFFGASAKERAEDVSRKYGLNKNRYAVFHIVPGHASKNWDNGKFAVLIKDVLAKGIIPVLVGSGSDTGKVASVVSLVGQGCMDLTGRTDLGTLYFIIKNACFFVGVDSAPSHIAAYSGVETLILFSGLNDPSQWAPRGANVKVIFPGAGKDLNEIDVEEVMSIICRKR